MSKLQQQTGFADTGLADEKDDLSMALARLAKQSCNVRNSRVRPTMGVKPRSAATSRRVRASRAVRTFQAVTGSVFPFKAKVPRGRVVQ